MSLSYAFVAGCAWLIMANVMGMLPSKDNQWTNARILMVLGLPLTVWIYQSHGLWGALIFLALAASILRWPLWHLWLRIKKSMGNG
ncbi:MAG: DUF2484 family protein [Rhodobacteraceae bacterium]|nr:DUF2484 family protein [Paracoccaceae bacterium]